MGRGNDYSNKKPVSVFIWSCDVWTLFYEKSDAFLKIAKFSEFLVHNSSYGPEIAMLTCSGNYADTMMEVK